MAVSFSIVLPIHDSPLDHLRAQLEAIATQRGDVECIVVDDGSPTDAPARVVEEFVARDRRVRLVRRSVNGGIAAATNDGIDAAGNDWLVFCDHDDLLDPDALAAIEEHIERHPQVDAIYTDERLIDESGQIVAEYAKPGWSPIRQLGHHYPAHVTAMRLSAIGDVRVRAEFEPSQDYDFWLRVVERIGADRPAGAARVGHVDRALYGWRAIEGSSALAASEKPEMCEAVRRCVAAAVERRGLAAAAHTVMSDAGPTTAVRLDWHDRPDDLTAVEIAPTLTAADLVDAVATVPTRFVALVPHDAATVDRAVWRELAAEVAGRADVVAAGPRVADRAGNLLSNGRTIGEGGLADAHEGYAIDDGPWGADLVVREVSAISPIGLVLDRAAFLELAAPLSVADPDTDSITLDVAVAWFCRLAADADRQVVIAPHHVVTVDDRDGWRLDGRHRLAHRRGWTEVAGRPTGRRDRNAGDGGGAADMTTDRHAVEGRRTGSSRVPTVYDVAVASIDSGDVELVTSDVFDTLVTRRVARPDHLFVSLGEALLDAGVLRPPSTPLRFAAARSAAERRARRDELECTLEEIWEHLGADLGVDPTVGVAAELDHEAAHLAPIPEGVALLERAAEVGVAVALVSDIYLSAQQLSSLLERVGVPMECVDAVVTSSARRLGKAHGLLARVIDEHGVPASRVLHVGDHPVADVETARDLGASTCHVDLPRADHHVDAVTAPMRWWSSRTGTDLGVSAVVRRGLLTAQFGRFPAYQLGAAGFGPAMYGFARWIDATARSLDVGAAHFLLREGATIADLVGIAAPDGGLDRRRVHASRWVDVRATVVEGRPDEIRAALERRSHITVDHVADAFDLDADRVRATIGSTPFHPAHFDDLAELLADDDELRTGIVDASASLRGRVTALLERELDLSNRTVLLVDIGWGGRIHAAIERLLRLAGHDHHVVGLFLAMSDSGTDRVAAGADLRSYLPNSLDPIDAVGDPTAAALAHAFAHQPDVVERTMMPPTPTFVDVADDLTPVLAARTEPRPPSAATTQRGVRDVVRALANDAAENGADDRWVTDTTWRAALASAVHDAATRPSQPVARVVREWSHDDVGGTDVSALTRSSSGLDDERWVEAASARDIEALHTGTAAWVDLVAAAGNPATAAQRWAVADGHDLDLISPRHPTGWSTLSVFADGSDEPALQRLVELGATIDGWTAIRVDGEVAAPRALRFDPGLEPALVEVGAIVIEARSGDDVRSTEVVDVGDPRVVGQGIRVVGRTRFAAAADGHLVVPITDVEPFGPIERTSTWSLSVGVRFRRWSIDADDDALTPSRLDEVSDTATRALRVARRAAARLRR